MNAIPKPDVRPANPRFSSGPCTKPPGWSLDQLEHAFVGRSHRHATGKARLKDVITRTRDVLGIPESYHIAIVPGSDTGAMEMALWSMLGARGVDMLAWESFGAIWAADVTAQLRLDDVRVLEAPYGDLPDLGAVDFSRDVVFTWNGTTSGVCVPDGGWIDAGRQGEGGADGAAMGDGDDIAAGVGFGQPFDNGIDPHHDIGKALAAGWHMARRGEPEFMVGRGVFAGQIVMGLALPLQIGRASCRERV